jgi:hypothetical protein
MMKKSELLHHGLMLLFVIAAYWPLSSFHHTTRWDSVETYFPFRYFMSDCLRNGELPLWLPYQLGGYPFYADPQSGAWYPLAWILCSVGPYTLHTFAIEFILTVFIAGAGMYRLTKSFDAEARIALIAGIAYSACGFFISGAEYITWVVSAAWLPWIFWSYHRMTLSGKYGYALLTALFLYLLLSGGYPSFLAVALYLMIVFFALLMLRRQPAASRRSLLWLHLLTAAAFVVVSVGVLASWYHARAIISRGAELSLEAVNNGPFSPRCLESLILPFVTLRGDDVYITDISMRNAYIGLCCLLMLPFAAGSLRNRKMLVIALAAVFCLTAAMGDYLPVRGWLYDYVPLMRLFRLPAFFRIFFIIGAIIFSATGIAAFLDNISRNWRWLVRMLAALLAGLILLFIYSVLKHGFTWGWGTNGHTFRAHYYLSGRAEHVQLQCLVQIVLLGILLAGSLYRGGRFLNSGTLLIFCIADMFLAARLNAYGTVVYMEDRAATEAPIKSAPRSFPVPDNGVGVLATSDQKRNLGPLRTNTSIYFKTPAPDGYNSFLLNSFNRLAASPIRDSVWANPYLYFASGVSRGADSTPLDARSQLRVDTLLYDRLHTLYPLQSGSQDIRVLEFSPDKIIAALHTEDSALLNLQQNYVAGWKMSVDGRNSPLMIANYTQMAALIPPGKHLAVWTFDPPGIRAMIAGTIAALALLIATLLIFRKRLLGGGQQRLPEQARKAPGGAAEREE